MGDNEAFFGIPEGESEEETPGVQCQKCGKWYMQAKGHTCAAEAAPPKEEPQTQAAPKSAEPSKPKPQAKPKTEPKPQAKPKPERIPIDPVAQPMHSREAEPPALPAHRPAKLSEIAVQDGKIDLSNLGNLAAVCEKFATTEMVPKQYRGRPADMMVAALFGMECGLTFFFSIQNVAVVNGRPCLYGDAPLALVRSKSQIEEFIEDFGFVDEDGEYRPIQAHSFGTLDSYPDNFAWRCYSKRRGSKGKGTETIITVGMCKQAGWWDKRGYENKSTPWVTTPWRMGKFRARGFTLRDEHGDAIGGLGIAEVETIEVEGYSEAMVPDGSLKDKPAESRMELATKETEDGKG